MRMPTFQRRGCDTDPNEFEDPPSFETAVASAEASSVDRSEAVSSNSRTILGEVCSEPGNLQRCWRPKRRGGLAPPPKLVPPKQVTNAKVAVFKGVSPALGDYRTLASWSNSQLVTMSPVRSRTLSFRFDSRFCTR